MLGSAFFCCLSITIAGVVLSRDRLMGIGQAITMPAAPPTGCAAAGASGGWPRRKVALVDNARVLPTLAFLI